MAAPSSSEPRVRPEVADILVVIHDFQARGSDELTLAKGDRVELIERDDEFGDGWFLGRHMINGNSGLFPEVYTRPAPKGLPASTGASPLGGKQPLSTVAEASPEQRPAQTPAVAAAAAADMRHTASPSVSSQRSIPTSASTPMTLPPGSAQPSTTYSPATAASLSKTPSMGTSSSTGSMSRLASGPDSQVLHDTLNVINEHITDLSATARGNGGLHVPPDSGSEYSSHIDHRMSYIQGEETDEEEQGLHTRPEVESWGADEVAEYLFTLGVEKHHCEVFRDQEITGEVLLGMDQTSLFIKAFDLGSVGRRLKTWQKIKNLQDEVSGLATAARRTSEAGSDGGARARSRNNTLTTSVQRLPPPIGDRPGPVQGKRLSVAEAQDQGTSPLPPQGAQDGPALPHHEKRPSAASVRDLHHSRRHSSTDFRSTGTTLIAPNTPNPRALVHGGTFPQADAGHKKQPSFDRNWTLGGASPYHGGPLSPAGLDDTMMGLSSTLQEPPDLDRGYFSGTEVDGRKRMSKIPLKRRDGIQPDPRNSSYAEEQRVRSATAISRHSRYGSIGSAQGDSPTAPAAQRYHGGYAAADARRRTASTNTTSDSVRNRPVPPEKDYPPLIVTKLDGPGPDTFNASPTSAGNRSAMSPDWLSRPGLNGLKAAGLGLRAISDAVTGHERSKGGSSSGDLPAKDSPLRSPSRTGSSTPSAGPSFELDSPSASKSPSWAAGAASRGARKKGKKETSAYLRGLLQLSPKEAMLACDYSGWMKKRSSSLMTTWKPRLFVLKGRRLAYYYGEDDEQERGLIDISFHRVLPADNERLTGLHATLTGASREPNQPAGSSLSTLAVAGADADADADATGAPDSMFIFKLVPPRAGLSRAVNFTKPTVHYFAVQNVKQGRLWMAALMKATIDRDGNQPITTTYQQKTISLAKARQMRHRPPALMNLDEDGEDVSVPVPAPVPAAPVAAAAEREDGAEDGQGQAKKDVGGLGIFQFSAADSAVSGIDRAQQQQQQQQQQTVESAGPRKFSFEGLKESAPQST